MKRCVRCGNEMVRPEMKGEYCSLKCAAAAPAVPVPLRSISDDLLAATATEPDLSPFSLTLDMDASAKLEAAAAEVANDGLDDDD